jgi:hypothetical protein
VILLKKTLLSCIKEAVEKGILKEPFDAENLKEVCSGFADKTYRLFLVHHRRGNPINQPEFFERNAAGKYSYIKEK